MSNIQHPITNVKIKPIAVTVFGILNIIFGGLGIVLAILALLVEPVELEQDNTIMQFTTNDTWNSVVDIAGVGFSFFSLILGVALLKMRNWARRGTILYAYIEIAWVLFVVGINIAVLMFWMNAPKWILPSSIVNMMPELILGLIYPVLLLIFMKSAKVKQAFEAAIMEECFKKSKK